MKYTLLALVIAVILSACVTMKLPDGTITTRPDTEATIAILQSSITIAQQALDAYIQFAQEQQRLEDEETQREIARQRERIEMLTGLLSALRPQHVTTQNNEASNQ